MAFRITRLEHEPCCPIAVAWCPVDTEGDPTQFKRVHLSPNASSEQLEELSKTIYQQAKESKGTWRQRLRNFFSESDDSPSRETLAIPTNEDFASWIHDSINFMQ